MKGQPLRFEPVGRPRLPSLGCPLEADFRVEVEDQRQVGPVRANRQALERGDEFAAADSPPRPDRPGSNSANRSETTQAPRASAGRIVLSRWSTRAAENSNACAAGLNPAAKPERIASRNASAPGDPPGSRVRTTASPSAARRSSSRLAWTDLPSALAALERDESAPCLPGHRLARRGAASVSILVQSRRTEPTANPSSKRRLKPCRRRLFQHGSARIGNEPRALGSKLDQLTDVDPNPAFGSASSNAGPCSKGVIEPAAGGSA